MDNILRERAAAGPFLARPVAVGPDQTCPSCCSSPKGGRCCQNGSNGNGGGNGSNGNAGSTPYLKFGMSAILAAESKEKIAAKNVLAVSGEFDIFQSFKFL